MPRSSPRPVVYERTCGNPKCPHEATDASGVFRTSMPFAQYCSQRCRQQARYDRRRQARMAELGLVAS